MLDERKLIEQGLPQDTVAEKTILGALLWDNKLFYTEGADTLDESDFALSSHRTIFRAMRNFLLDGRTIDSLILRADLISNGCLDSVGGYEYLLSFEEYYRWKHIREYVAIVREHSLRRGALLVAQRIFDEAMNGRLRTRDILEGSISTLQDAARESHSEDLQRVGDFLATQGTPEQMFDRLATYDGLKFHFDGLDELIGGLQPGDLCVVAARPSMGKTAWACNIAHNIAVKGGKTTAFFSLEQSRNAMIRRMLAAAARVDYKDIRNNDLRAQDRELLLERRAILATAPLYIDDQTGLTGSRIKSKCARLKEEHGLDIAIIDQLSKMSMADCKERDFRLKIGEQTKGLKRMGQDLGIPVVVFNQLSRESGKRSDPRPQLSDLKESGNIEEDADVVIFLHRPEYYDKTDDSLKGKGENIVAKNREGATGIAHCTWNGRIMRWEDIVEPVAQQDNFYDRGNW